MTAADFVSDPDAGYGTCPECGERRQLKKDGTLRHHAGPPGSDPNNWLNRRAYRCKGAGEKPKKEQQ